jgi:hypothetical protein
MNAKLPKGYTRDGGEGSGTFSGLLNTITLNLAAARLLQVGMLRPT